MIRFDWKDISEWDVDDEGLCFAFQYAKPEKKTRTIRIHTPFYVFMNDCFERVSQERKWYQSLPPD